MAKLILRAKTSGKITNNSTKLKWLITLSTLNFSFSTVLILKLFGIV